MGADKQCLVLIVEDDESIAQFVESVLSDEGYQVEVASDGEEGLQAVDRTRPDLVLLDMLLPVMDGPTFLRELRQHHAPAPPVVVMSAARDEITPEGGLVEAEGRLPKPFELTDLLEEVDRLVGRTCERA